MHNSLFPRTFDFFAGAEPFVGLVPLCPLFVVFVVVIALGSIVSSLGLVLAMNSFSNPIISSFVPTGTTHEEKPSNPLTVQLHPAVTLVDGRVMILERGTIDTEFSSDHITKQWCKEIMVKNCVYNNYYVCIDLIIGK
jgi:hypothetical protein